MATAVFEPPWAQSSLHGNTPCYAPCYTFRGTSRSIAKYCCYGMSLRVGSAASTQSQTIVAGLWLRLPHPMSKHSEKCSLAKKAITDSPSAFQPYDGGLSFKYRDLEGTPRVASRNLSFLSERHRQIDGVGRTTRQIFGKGRGRYNLSGRAMG